MHALISRRDIVASHPDQPPCTAMACHPSSRRGVYVHVFRFRARVGGCQAYSPSVDDGLGVLKQLTLKTLFT